MPDQPQAEPQAAPEPPHEQIAKLLVKAAKINAPNAQAMPDSAIRRHWFYQLFVRLARPTLDWVGVMGASYAMGLGDAINSPMPTADRLVTLTFVGALYGIRTYEKKVGVG